MFNNEEIYHNPYPCIDNLISIYGILLDIEFS